MFGSKAVDCISGELDTMGFSSLKVLVSTDDHVTHDVGNVERREWGF